MTRALLLALCAAVAVAGCVRKRPPAEPEPRAAARAPTTPAPRPAKPPSPRTTLRRYVDLTLAGRHTRAWPLLTAADQRRLPRDAYVRREQANDALRQQLAALGRARHRVVSLKVQGDEAVAVVELRTGLGAERLIFVLRLEGGAWRVAYGRSWQRGE
jgi:hypothetical protein